MNLRFASVAALMAGLAGCATGKPTIPQVASVDLQRFMGDWYVIAHIPARQEREAYNAVESYRLEDGGRIQTTFRFRKGSFDAPLETMEPVGKVVEGSNNAVWGMQFVWPIKAEYVIADLASDYSTTIIGRSKRDYVWLMARQPVLPEEQYAALVERIRVLGYDTAELRKVPQKWPETGPAPRKQP